jgi:hypothetical protein
VELPEASEGEETVVSDPALAPLEAVDPGEEPDEAAPLVLCDVPLPGSTPGAPDDAPDVTPDDEEAPLLPPTVPVLSPPGGSG